MVNSISSITNNNIEKAKELLSQTHTTIAMNNLGMLLMKSHQEKQAIELFLKAADLNYCVAQKNISGAYQNGIGVPKSFDKQFSYMKKSADQGYLESQCYFTRLCEFVYKQNNPLKQNDNNIQNYETNISENPINQSQLSSRVKYSFEEIKKRNSLNNEQEHKQEQDKTEIKYRLPEEIKQSRIYLKMAAHRGMSQALIMLAAHYTDYGGKKEKIILSLRGAAAHGIANVQVLLAQILDNPKEKIELYRSAANKGNALAMHNLSICLLKGEGCERDLNEGFYWIKKAAELGYPSSMQNYGLLLFHGIGCQKNRRDAEMWCQKAAEKRLQYDYDK